MIDLKQSAEYVKYMESIGWTVERVNGTFAYIKKFPIIGNFIKLQHPEQLSNKTIKHLVNKYEPFQFVIEPRYSSHIIHLTTHNFRQNRNYFVPSKTIQIDLTKSKNQLLQEMHYKTRYNIKKEANLPHLTFHISKDIFSFADFWQECAIKQRGMFLSQKTEIIGIYKAFGKKAQIILVQNKKEILSGVLLICTKDTAYYMYAASTIDGKKLFAPTINVWEAIKLAKKLGYKIFDFEGIYDERFPIKTWQGFTRFKKSFGGSEIEYPGAFVKFRFPFLNLFSV